MNPADAAGEERFEAFEHLPVAEGKAFQNGAAEFGMRCGRRLAVGLAVGGDLGGHVARLEESIGMEYGGEGACGGSHLSHFGVGVTISFQGPGFPALLPEPESGNVLEQADTSFDADFIGEVEFGGTGVDNGFGQFHTHQRPCATADVAPVRGALDRDGGNSGSGVVAGHGVHRDSAVERGAEERSGVHDIGEDARVQSEAR
jgi:hypothetical protein